jgi:phytoene dehydrogenase-like protein
MTEYTSIRVTQAAKEAAEASKRDGETWNEYLQRCTDNPPEVREYVAANGLDDQLDRIESAAKEATNAAQNAERAAEELQR